MMIQFFLRLKKENSKDSLREEFVAFESPVFSIILLWMVWLG